MTASTSAEFSHIPERFQYQDRSLDDATTFFDAFFIASAVTEVPLIYNRWAILAGVGALLGRQYFLPFGRGHIYPNLYCMFIGDPGARKTTAIKDVTRILRKAGYSTIAAAKTSKEQFLDDLQHGSTDHETGPDAQTSASAELVMREMFGNDVDLDLASPMLIAADEFNNFAGINNLDFISLLGELYDYDGIYKYRLRSGKSIRVPNPIISILGGNTHAGFSLCFPPETLEQGFLSRLILVYGKASGKKISWPEIPEAETERILVEWIERIRSTVTGPATVHPHAYIALDRIYHEWTDLEDSRFRHYSTRRHTQLLKLCLITSATRLSTTITFDDVILANSILTFTEQSMPKALGEFGRARNSGVASKILTALYNTDKVLNMMDLYKIVSHDVEKMKDLAPIVEGLLHAGKIQSVQGGFLPVATKSRAQDRFVDFALLPEYYLS